jgi:hypothetical protein
VHEAYTGNLPDASQFLISRCTAYVLIPENKWQKVNGKTVKCTFIGFVKDKRAYCCIDRTTGQIYESQDVIFVEDVAEPPERVMVEVPTMPTDNREMCLVTSNESIEDSDADLLEAENSDNDSDDDEKEELQSPSPSQTIQLSSILLPPPITIQSSHPSHTWKAPIPDDDQQYFVLSYGSKNKESVSNASTNVVQSILNEPETYQEAMSQPDAQNWKIACVEELASFMKTEIYDEVERPQNH